MGGGLNTFYNRVNCLVNMEARQDNHDKRMFDQQSLSFLESSLVSPFSKTGQTIHVWNFGWPFNRGKDNRTTLIGTTKRWPRLLKRWLVNRGFTLQYLTDNYFEASITGRWIEVLLYDLCILKGLMFILGLPLSVLFTRPSLSRCIIFQAD